jgi:hypothetical protein
MDVMREFDNYRFKRMMANILTEIRPVTEADIERTLLLPSAISRMML